MRRLWKILVSGIILVLLYMVFYSYFAVKDIELRQEILKNCFEEVKTKHNRLRVIVQRMWEEGR